MSLTLGQVKKTLGRSDADRQLERETVIKHPCRQARLRYICKSTGPQKDLGPGK